MGWKADVPLANYLKPIVKNRRNTIAKWTLAPAIATGLVGAFIEKKAQTNTESGAAGMAAGAALGAAMAHPKSRKAIKKAISGRRRPGWAEKELANLSAKPFKSRSKSEQNKIFDVFNSVKAQKGTAEAKETIRKKFKLSRNDVSKFGGGSMNKTASKTIQLIQKHASALPPAPEIKIVKPNTGVPAAGGAPGLTPPKKPTSGNPGIDPAKPKSSNPEGLYADSGTKIATALYTTFLGMKERAENG